MTAIVVASQNSPVLRAKTKVVAPIVADRRLVRLNFRNRRDGDDPELVVFHQLVFDRSSLTRWRQRMSEEKLLALLQESPAVAARTETVKPSDLARVVIDTTVQPKVVIFPTDAKLINRAREPSRIMSAQNISKYAY